MTTFLLLSVLFFYRGKDTSPAHLQIQNTLLNFENQIFASPIILRTVYAICKNYIFELKNLLLIWRHTRRHSTINHCPIDSIISQKNTRLKLNEFKNKKVKKTSGISHRFWTSQNFGTCSLEHTNLVLELNCKKKMTIWHASQFSTSPEIFYLLWHPHIPKYLSAAKFC